MPSSGPLPGASYTNGGVVGRQVACQSPPPGPGGCGLRSKAYEYPGGSHYSSSMPPVWNATPCCVHANYHCGCDWEFSADPTPTQCPACYATFYMTVSYAPPPPFGGFLAARQLVAQIPARGFAGAFGELEPEPPPDLELAFSVEPAVGWRIWKLVQFELRDGTSVARLASVGVDGFWKPGERTEARCQRGSQTQFHEAPWPACFCGFWALNTRELALDVPREYRLGTYVIGECDLWGRVLDCERGWRAQYAYPRSLTVTGRDATAELAGELAAAYRIKVDWDRPPPPPPPSRADYWDEDTLKRPRRQLGLVSRGEDLDV